MKIHVYATDDDLFDTAREKDFSDICLTDFNSLVLRDMRWADVVYFRRSGKTWVLKNRFGKERYFVDSEERCENSQTNRDGTRKTVTVKTNCGNETHRYENAKTRQSSDGRLWVHDDSGKVIGQYNKDAWVYAI